MYYSCGRPIFRWLTTTVTLASGLRRRCTHTQTQTRAHALKEEILREDFFLSRSINMIMINKLFHSSGMSSVPFPITEVLILPCSQDSVMRSPRSCS